MQYVPSLLNTTEGSEQTPIEEIREKDVVSHKCKQLKKATFCAKVLAIAVLFNYTIFDSKTTPAGTSRLKK